MKLYLDQFEDEALALHFEPSVEETAELLEDTGYTAASKPLHIDFDARRSGTTIRLQGHIEGLIAFECGRCLEAREVELDTRSEFVLLDREAWEETYEEQDEIELDEQDLDVSFYDGEEIDLRSLVREAVLLDLPTLPRCPEGLRAVCDEAYRRNVGEDVLEENEENSIDLRWGPLKDIKLKD